MNYLLGTNVISKVCKGFRYDSNVTAWYASIDDTNIYLSVLVLGKIRKGVECTRPNDSSAQALTLEEWLETVVKSVAECILPVDQAVADEWGRMGAKRPVPPCPLRRGSGFTQSRSVKSSLRPRYLKRKFP